MNTFFRTGMVLVAGLAFGLAACEEKAAPPSKPAPATAAAPANVPGLVQAPAALPSPVSPAAAVAPITGGNQLAVLGVSLPLPEGFKQFPPSNSMRLADVRVDDATGSSPTACVIAVSTAGGGVDSNLDRWAGQVLDATGNPSKRVPSEPKMVSGLKVSSVELTGTFVGMGDGAPKTNWTLHGAIVETPEGLLFLKMTGPADAMKAAAGRFQAMLDGLK
ncbi:MAG: hypothetical protein NTV94_17910, partial [Planctomycetota bacterium]|nr:hypothetical protein [Planctomycetota bacterium]